MNKREDIIERSLKKRVRVMGQYNKYMKGRKTGNTLVRITPIVAYKPNFFSLMY